MRADAPTPPDPISRDSAMLIRSHRYDCQCFHHLRTHARTPPPSPESQTRLPLAAPSALTAQSTSEQATGCGGRLRPSTLNTIYPILTGPIDTKRENDVVYFSHFNPAISRSTLLNKNQNLLPSRKKNLHLEIAGPVRIGSSESDPKDPVNTR